jgi:hypothetical protein
MTPYPDKLFSEKLSAYRKDPPASAWNRINMHLIKGISGRRYAWIIAASLIVLVSSFLVLFQSQSAEINHETKVTITAPSEATIILPDTSTVRSDVSTSSKAKTLKETSSSIVPLFAHPEATQLSSPTVLEVSISEQESLKEDIVLENLHPTVPDEFATSNSEVSVTLNKGQRIEYSREEVNKRFLRKSPTVNSGINEIAIIKHQDLPQEKIVEFGLGELRRWKDELLSFELRMNNENQKNTN